MGKEAINTENNIDNPSMGKKSIFLKKKISILIVIVIISILVIIGFLFLTLDSYAEAKAQLSFDSEIDIVMVKHNGESWIPAENEMDLYQSDSIKTGDNSSASIIIFKGSIIRLDSNTEVTLAEIIKEEETLVTIEQSAGRTWSTVKKMSGIDSYEVKTPTAVASVRGTSFDVNLIDDGITIVSVIKGLVNVTLAESETIYNVKLNENYSINVSYDEIGEPQSFELDDWIKDNLLEDEEFKEDLKDYLYEKIEPYMDELKNDIGMTDEEIDILINGYIEGDFTIPPETPDEFKELFQES